VDTILNDLNLSTLVEQPIERWAEAAENFSSATQKRCVGALHVLVVSRSDRKRDTGIGKTPDTNLF
jgi:hypothetical protein